jgi:hypothetical protein
VQQDHKVCKDQRVILAQQVALVHKDRKARQAQRAHKGQRVHRQQQEISGATSYTTRCSMSYSVGLGHSQHRRLQYTQQIAGQQ